jgi:PAS domain S-box-containing protein
VEIQDGVERPAFRISREDRERAGAAWQEARKQRAAVIDTYRMGNSQAGYRTYLVHVVPTLDEAGEITEWVGTATDIEARVQAEEQRQESERRFRELTNAIPAICWSSDAKGRVSFVNGYAATFTGRSIEELMGDGYVTCIHPADTKRAAELFGDATRKGVSYDVEYRMLTAEGGYRWQMGRAVPFKDAQGKVTGWIGALIDIHDARERSEEQIAAAQRFQQLADALPVLA